MTTSQLHPWLSTPEALKAAHKATSIPFRKMPVKANIVGRDELESQALLILTECAAMPREQLRVMCATCGGSLEGVRKGAKFCSQKCRRQRSMDVLRSKDGAERPRGQGGVEALPPQTQGHVGSMWKWPEDQMEQYAIREVGFVLNNYLRTRGDGRETPAGETLANFNAAIEEEEPTPREIVEAYLDSRGIRWTDETPFEELCEAAQWARKAER